jgi:GNAT superfamily N-acetyltransferase
MLKIESIRVADVFAFATEAAQAPAGEYVAISPSRALAWTRNPYAAPDDVALLVGYLDGRCVGCLGLLPGRAAVGGELLRIFWASTFHVAEQARSSGLGGMLIMRALALRGDILNTGFSEEAAAVYRAIGFRPFGPLTYLTADLASHNLLDLPKRALRRMSRSAPITAPAAESVARGLGTLGNVSAYRDLRAWATRQLREVECRTVKRFSERPSSLDETGIQTDHFMRNAEVVQWMLENPWVVSGDAPKSRSFFADWAARFEYAPLEMHRRSSDEWLGSAVLRLEERDARRSLTVFDHRVAGASGYPILAAAAIQAACDFQAERISLPIECEPALVAEPSVGRFFQRAERGYLAHCARGSQLAPHLATMRLELSDGDVPFA